jgi:hypothetical protein
LDANGTAEQIEWLRGTGDGFLVDTSRIGSNNAINGNALFTDNAHQSGFAHLATRDANGDGRLTGAELNNIAVWVDNGDARLQAGELRTLAQVGVNEISLQTTSPRNAAGEVLDRSTASGTGGTFMTEDVFLARR